MLLHAGYKTLAGGKEEIIIGFWIASFPREIMTLEQGSFASSI